MRSITLKLTLAFLFVGLTGSIIVAVLTQIQTRQEFNRFVLDLYQSEMVTDLVDYYEENGSWEGVQETGFSGRPSRGGLNDPERGGILLIVDNEEQVVVGPRELIGTTLRISEQQEGLPLEVDGEVVGWMLINIPKPGDERSPEGDFIDRLNKNVIVSALIATSLALIIGIVLARTISHPISDLQAATRIVAEGNLGYQVPVVGKDELGQLGHSFNQMSADLAQSNALRRQMTADIAHELRNPLSVILGYTEALSDEKLEGEAATFQVMHEEVLHLQRLIEDLRTLSLADAGELSLVKQPITPAALLAHVATAHNLLAAEKQVALEVQAAEGLPEISVDPDRIVQVLGNVVANALRYTPAQGKIKMTAERDSAGITFRVTDTGVGVSEEDLPYIFERFYRVDKARYDNNNESGLGLAIAKSIVEAHGGSISAESTPGKGTTFTILLPQN